MNLTTRLGGACLLLTFLFYAPTTWAAPAAVTGLTAEQNSQIQLSWTVPAPQPNLYDIRWSTSGPITSNFDFTVSTPLGVSILNYAVNPSTNPVPATAGSQQTLILP